MKVRAARAGDATAIAGLITELGYPTDAEAMAGRLTPILAHADYATLVAERDGIVVGVIGAAADWFYERDGRVCRLLALVVSSSVRHQGVGSRLVEAIERWAVERGASGIVVTSALRRTDTHGFYERRGYARTGLRFVKPLPHAGA